MGPAVFIVSLGDLLLVYHQRSADGTRNRLAPFRLPEQKTASGIAVEKDRQSALCTAVVGNTRGGLLEIT